MAELLNECCTILSLTVFTQRNFVADFLQVKCTFTQQTAILHCELLLGGLEAMYAVHLRLIGKCIVDFLLATIKHFPLGITAEALRANID